MTQLLFPGDSLLLYGLYEAGKTTQLIELIKHEFKATGKKALLYGCDTGSLQSLERELVQPGLADLERYRFPDDPHIFVDSAATGRRRVNGKWTQTDLSQYCLVANESLTGLGDLVVGAIGKQVAEGRNVGGDAMKAPKLAIQAEGYVINIAANSPTHYNMAQKFLLEKVLQSQALPIPVVWTAHEDVAIPAKRDDSGNLRPEVAVDIGVQGMIGPLIAGHALTMHLGKYFVYMFRIKSEIKPNGIVRVLLSTRHKDGLYEGLGANRAPLGSVVPGRMEPADIVKLLTLVNEAKAKAVVGVAK